MTKFLRLALLSLLISAPAWAQLAVPVTNAGTTGTTLNSTAIINSSNNAVIATTSSTSVPVYIVLGGAGTSGQAQLAVLGQASCTMDATLASAAGGYYVIASVTNAGYCHPQAAAPAANVWVIGFLAASSTSSGAAALVNVNSFIYGGSGGGGSGTVNSGTANHLTYYASTGTAVNSDANLDDGATTANTLTYAGSGGIATTGSSSGSVALSGSSSGTLTLTVPTTGTPYTLQLPSVVASGSNTYLSCTAATPSICSWAAGGGGGGGAFPQTVSGTTTSGGITYFSNTTTLASSGVLNANVLVKGGGTGVAPTNSSVTDSGTTVTSTDTGGFVAPVFVANGTTAGFMDFPQGTTSASVAPCNTATSICVQAPTAVTSYLMVLPGAAPSGSNTYLSCTAANPSVCSWSAGGASSGVSSISGDGTLITNSSSTGTTTLTLGTATAHKFWGNNTGSTTTPGYSALGAQDWGPGSYVAGGGTAQAQTATFSPAVTSEVAGLQLRWLPTAANTATAPTIAPNGLTALTITKLGHAALVANDLTTTAIADCIYDGTDCQLQNPQTAPTGTGVTSIATTSPITGGTITTTGTIACASCVTSSSPLTSTNIMTGAGSQTTQTPSSAATVSSTGAMTALTLTLQGTTAGFMDFPQGTTSSAVAPCNTATSVCIQAPTSVTSYLLTLPSAAPTANNLAMNCSTSGVCSWSGGTVVRGTLTFTSATSDSATVTGATTSSICTFSPTNATAATNIATTYLGTISANTVPITHVTGASGGTVNVICTLN